MARDQQAPRSFLHIGDRLTFSAGIVLLSAGSAAIYVALHGNTARLLPLYAVGVFLAFTLSQSGMVVHWRRHHDQPHWRRSLFLNATGAVLSGTVFVIATAAKFPSGAWIALVLIVLIVLIALRTRRYYEVTKQELLLVPGESHDGAPHTLPVAPRPPRPRSGGQGTPAGEQKTSKAEAADILTRSTPSRSSRSSPWTGRPCGPSPMRPHSASPRSLCTSARRRKKLSGSVTMGDLG